MSVTSQTTQTLSYASVRASNLVIAVHCANQMKRLNGAGWERSGVCNAKQDRKRELMGSHGDAAEDWRIFVVRVDTRGGTGR